MNCTEKKRKKDQSHCGSGCYWISEEDFPSPGEDDVVMNLECAQEKVCVCGMGVGGLRESDTCIHLVIFWSYTALALLL